jgi:hypothetical protein
MKDLKIGRFYLQYLANRSIYCSQGLSEVSVFDCIHRDALELFNVCNDLRKVCQVAPLL